MGWMVFDLRYLLFLLPALLLAAWASAVTKSTFAKYAKVRAQSGMTGAEAAYRLLARHGLHSVSIKRGGGFLSDHYNPATRTLSLSPDVYEGRSLSAIGVACHEAGHALQHADRYAALAIRTALVPAAQLGSGASYFFIFIGFILNSMLMFKVGIVMFSMAVLFALITLPVEWNASRRAKQLMLSSGIVTAGEAGRAGAVLNAAFLTYVASALTALMTLLYYLWRAGLLGGRR